MVQTPTSIMQTTCHPALLIYEVLLEVFHLLKQIDACTRLGTLTAAAATCRAWREPALDVLREEAGMLALFRLLSPSLWDSLDRGKNPVSFHTQPRR